ncbi:MAG: hypothetical protein F6J95_004355 [Leptolyngbya sp. SIO1E4]|nr:hypothetical protein [Leptolyngbya sp. SIO1E4]
MEEIKQEIQKHLETAYALLPPELEPYSPYAKRENLEQKYENKEWRQVFYYLQNYSSKNEFSTELLHHVESTEKLFNLYDCLGMKAVLEQLTSDEKRIIGECLCAAAFGPFFPDWEFYALFGVDRDEAVRVAESWPNIEATDISVGYVINDSINNLFGYPHRKQDEWKNYISVSPKQVYDIYNKFRELTGRKNNQQTGSAEYFHNMGA